MRAVGTVQDGGLPHVACTCERCERARREPSFRRRVASLAIVLPAGAGETAPGTPAAPDDPPGSSAAQRDRREPAPGADARRVWLIDATPDLREQLDALADVRGAAAGRVDRAPLDGLLLTHAHIGHYLGLAFLGFEAAHAQRLDVVATPRMAVFVRANAPWDQLVRLENIALIELAAGASFELGAGVTVTSVAVPHRDEYADTVAYRIAGPGSTIFYAPDTDGWERWEVPLPQALAGADVAILDGTFYSREELPGRDTAAIGHPLIVETMDLLAPAVRAGRLRVYFTHLNHSNRALEPESSERREIESRGFRVLAEGEEIGL